MAYVWKKNNACVASYKVLESNSMMDQFEAADIPFEQAGDVQMKKLRYFPASTSNPDIIKTIAQERARQFVAGLGTIYPIEKEDAQTSSGQIMLAIAKIFADGEKTMRDLAEVADNLIKFPDEK